jgi:hypothetical protein
MDDHYRRKLFAHLPELLDISPVYILKYLSDYERIPDQVPAAH